MNREEAIRIAQTAALAARGESHHYLPTSQAEADVFQPHAWVLDAIMAAVKQAEQKKNTDAARYNELQYHVGAISQGSHRFTLHHMPVHPKIGSLFTGSVAQHLDDSLDYLIEKRAKTKVSAEKRLNEIQKLYKKLKDCKPLEWPEYTQALLKYIEDAGTDQG